MAAFNLRANDVLADETTEIGFDTITLVEFAGSTSLAIRTPFQNLRLINDDAPPRPKVGEWP
ncbi:hypothetical protein ABH995_000805 [Bradyrhizobium yuanmingense]|uniref:hypothetical protein n=1 Tax=Bradyrhizobium yuanmingense TaxID=108015 RepID=UPI00351134FC